jgi:hypothetical protein
LVLEGGFSVVNAGGTITEQGNDISSGATPVFSTKNTPTVQDPTLANSTNNTDPQLVGFLDYNGGPTPTMALIFGSPAIDTADDLASPPFDERGVPRPIGLHSDMGAFEFGNPTVLAEGRITTGTNGTSEGLSYVTVVAQDTNGDVFTTTSTNGNYAFALPANTYSVTPQPVNGIGTFAPSSIANVVLSSNNVFNLDFLVTSAGTNGITRGTTNGGVIQVTFNLLPGLSYRIQASTNLSSPTNWYDVATNNSGASGIITFADSAATNGISSTNFVPYKFFRAVSP